MTVAAMVWPSDLLPYLQLVVLAAATWVVRELIVRQGLEQSQRARAILHERLEKAYGPMYHIVGEMLQTRLTGVGDANEPAEALRMVLRAHGHHLRHEHELFCVKLMLGWHPSPAEAFWHRHSVFVELEKLRFLVYGPQAELEKALSSQAGAVLWRWAGRVLDFVLAIGLWVAIFVGMMWVAFRAGSEVLPRLAIAGAMILAVWTIRQVVTAVQFRRQFPSKLLKRVKRGDHGDDVRLVQLMLHLSGYDLGAHGSDGVFGRDTERAVRRFQSGHGLPETGRLDEQTRVRLYSVAQSGGSRYPQL